MFSKLKKLLFPTVEQRSTTRTYIEIGLFYIILSGIILLQPKLPNWTVGLLTVLLVLVLFESGREMLRVILLAGVLVFGLIRPFVVEPFYIPSRSMENTLLVNDHIFVSKFSYWFSSPDRWEITVFQYPKNQKLDYIKRVVGLPGDKLAIDDHQLIINGDPVSRRISHREVEFSFLQNPTQVSTTKNPFTKNYRFRADGVQFNRDIEIGENPTNPLRGFIGLTNVVREANHHFVKEMKFDYRSGTHDLSTDFGPVRIPEEGQKVDLTLLGQRERNYYKNLMEVWFESPITIRNGMFYRNGRMVETLKIREPVYFVMGDNRDHSEDSRVWGFVPSRLLQGRALFIYYPLTRIGWVGS